MFKWPTLIFAILIASNAQAVLLTYDFVATDGTSARIVYEDTSVDGAFTNDDLVSVSGAFGNDPFATYTPFIINGDISGLYDPVGLAFVQFTSGNAVDLLIAPSGALLEFDVTGSTNFTLDRNAANTQPHAFDFSPPVPNVVPLPAPFALISLGLLSLAYRKAVQSRI